MADDVTNADNTPAEGADDSHITAARAFFSAAPEVAPDPAAAAKVAAVVKPDPVVKAKPDFISAIVKTAEPAKEAPVVDASSDLDKRIAALAEPDAKSKARAGWDELKGIVKSESERAKAFEAEIAKLKATPADAASKARIEQLEAREKELSERLKVVDLKNHPDFIREIDAPRTEIVGQLKSVLADEGVEGDIAAVLALPQKDFVREISKLGEQLSDFSKTQLFDSAKTYRALARKGEELMKNAETFVSTHQKQAAAMSRKTFDEVSREFLSGEFVKKQVASEKADDSEKADVVAYNTAFDQIQKGAEAVAFAASDERTVARVAHEASLFRFLISNGLPRINTIFSREIETRDAELATLRQQVAALSKAGELGAGGSGAGAPASTESEEDHKTAARRYWK